MTLLAAQVAFAWHSTHDSRCACCPQAAALVLAAVAGVALLAGRLAVHRAASSLHARNPRQAQPAADASGPAQEAGRAAAAGPKGSAIRALERELLRTAAPDVPPDDAGEGDEGMHQPRPIPQEPQLVRRKADAAAMPARQASAKRVAEAFAASPRLRPAVPLADAPVASVDARPSRGAALESRRAPAVSRLGGGKGSIARYLGVTAPPPVVAEAESFEWEGRSEVCDHQRSRGPVALEAGSDMPKNPAPLHADERLDGRARVEPLRPKRLGRRQAGPSRHAPAKPEAEQSPEFRRKAVISAYFGGAQAAAAGERGSTAGHARALDVISAGSEEWQAPGVWGRPGEQIMADAAEEQGVAWQSAHAGASIFGSYKAPPVRKV